MYHEHAHLCPVSTNCNSRLRPNHFSHFLCLYSEEQAKGLSVDVCDVSDRLTILVLLSFHLFGSESEVFGWHFSFTCVADSNGCCTPGAR